MKPIMNPTMNAHELALWQRIQAYQIDDATAARPFSKKLAAEQNWTVEYTATQIEAYKRFIFL